MVKDDFITENGNLYYFDATGNQPNFVFVSNKAETGVTSMTSRTKNYSDPVSKPNSLDRKAHYKTSVPKPEQDNSIT